MMVAHRRRVCLVLVFVLLAAAQLQGEFRWRQAESKHFAVIYLPPQEYLVPHVLNSAETALARLAELLKYQPSEKIVINLNDFSDFGSGGTTTIPHNLIRLEIEPLEPGYENIPYTERIQWLISHELVHVVVNDMASGTESLARSLFSKVPPEKNQPLSIFYSLLTNYTRYTPNWYQEGVAVFFETWLNGGFGRILGNFDEMYFRSMVLERKSFPTPYMLDAKEASNSFLLQTLNYLYGARFDAFLAAAFGTEKLLRWYTSSQDGFYKGYESKFKKVFGKNLLTVWNYFIFTEKRFQKYNLKTLSSAPLTPVHRLTTIPMGWVTQPYFDRKRAQIIFGSHLPNFLTGIYVFDIRRKDIRRIGSLPAPSLIRIASTAYDARSNVLFFTTDNNQLYRDIHAMNIATQKSTVLFKNVRMGDLTVVPATAELWGIRHAEARAALVYSPYPYRTLNPVIEFEPGDVLHDLSVSPSGNFLAATLHQATGRQAIIVADLRRLKQEGKFTFETISDDGSPEFPSWSPDENTLYWNAFTNGVSNIYRYDRQSSKITAVSHTLRGLFRPVFLNKDRLLAFEFTTEGFIPVTLPNRPAQHLPAIRYFGQKVVDNNPQVTQWALAFGPVADGHASDGNHDAANRRYSGLAKLRIDSFLPVISGFQNQKVVGIYTHLTDPLLANDFSFEAGATTFDRQPGGPRLHFRGKYEHNKQTRLEFEHNAPSFYDLFNNRKSSLIGNKFALGHTHYWKYDIPHKIKQTADLTVYTSVQAINDNLIKVTNPDFVIFESSLNSKNIRRAIGSVDSEFGHEWTITWSGLMSQPRHPQLTGGIHAEWNYYSPTLAPHNIFHVQLAAGILHNPENLAIGKFYFGGFGNRPLENKPVKQFRDVFRFPGVPIFSVDASRFAKIMLENNLPPLRFGQFRLGSHFLTHIDASWFAQGLFAQSSVADKWLNLGGQINFVFKHWYNLESTLSAGVAQAWFDGGNSREWFISYKLLRN